MLMPEYSLNLCQKHIFTLNECVRAFWQCFTNCSCLTIQN